MSDNQPVLYEVEAAVATITLNRPRYRNAVNYESLAALNEIADELISNPPRAVVLKAASPGFCSGVDLKESREATPES